MAKRKPQAPTSIRLSESANAIIDAVVLATGWSVSAALNHFVILGDAANTENNGKLKALRELLRTTAAEHKRQVAVTATLSTSQETVRRAIAAVKGVK
jgi:hypothetical protein